MRDSPLTTEHSLVRQALLGLVKDFYSDRNSGRVLNESLFARVAGTLGPLSPDKFEKLTEQEELRFPENGCIAVVPSPLDNPQWLPVLALEQTFGIERPHLSLRVAMFREGEDDSGDLRAIGFRFETMEGVGSKHDYCHIQLIKSLSISSEDTRWRLPNCPGWLPLTQPAIPIDASSPIQVMMCFVIGLYGRDRLSLIDMNLQHLLSKHVRGMHSSAA
jgi:hypothetical protein